MNFFPQLYFVENTVVNGYVADQSATPDRIYAQYRNKPKSVAWYKITMTLATKIASVSQAVKVMYNIDGATGDRLDIIGRIVVVDRNFMGVIPMTTTSFASSANSPGEFGDSLAMFSSTAVDQNQTMSDDLFRLAIKSKILKNNSFATIEEILFGMNFLLPNANVLRVVDNEDMSFSVEFYGAITELERWALLNAGFVPKPQGVKFNGFLEGYNYSEFGDSMRQFGDSKSEFVGFVGV